MLKFFRPYIIINNKTRKVSICKDKKNGINGCRTCCLNLKVKKHIKHVKSCVISHVLQD